MDEGTESLEKETGEKRTSKIEVKDGRGEIADAIQEREFKNRLENDKIEEKLIQFENFLGPYTNQKVTEGLSVNLVSGPFGSGEVVNGVLSVNLPTNSEILAATNDPRAEPLLKVLTDAGTTYKEIALISASSTTLHELEHTIIDSRPGSQLAIDFENAQPPEQKIVLDEGGHTLSLLDEGITYAFQMEKDSESVLFDKLRASKPQVEEKFTVETRNTLGQALRNKVKDYLDEGRQIDIVFLKFAGEEMNKLDMKKYATEAEQERLNRRIN